LKNGTLGPICCFQNEGLAVADDETNKARSATQMVRARQAEEGRKAMAEYEARAAFVRTNTERLRALRLAQEAARPAEPVEAKPAAKPAKKRKAKAPAA
jgi:hypothetical protein